MGTPSPRKVGTVVVERVAGCQQHDEFKPIARVFTDACVQHTLNIPCPRLVDPSCQPCGMILPGHAQ